MVFHHRVIISCGFWKWHLVPNSLGWKKLFGSEDWAWVVDWSGFAQLNWGWWLTSLIPLFDESVLEAKDVHTSHPLTFLFPEKDLLKVRCSFEIRWTWQARSCSSYMNSKCRTSQNAKKYQSFRMLLQCRRCNCWSFL